MGHKFSGYLWAHTLRCFPRTLRVLEVSTDTLVSASGAHILRGLGHRCLRAELETHKCSKGMLGVKVWCVVMLAVGR